MAGLNRVYMVITRLPFYVAPDEHFNEWIIDYLPITTRARATVKTHYVRKNQQTFKK
ncbi:MAG TPA: hypothetical protein VF666_02775 [Pyrinomonadaceae bacterium]